MITATQIIHTKDLTIAGLQINDLFQGIFLPEAHMFSPEDFELLPLVNNRVLNDDDGNTTFTAHMAWKVKGYDLSQVRVSVDATDAELGEVLIEVMIELLTKLVDWTDLLGEAEITRDTVLSLLCINVCSTETAGNSNQKLVTGTNGLTIGASVEFKSENEDKEVFTATVVANDWIDQMPDMSPPPQFVNREVLLSGYVTRVKGRLD